MCLICRKDMTYYPALPLGIDPSRGFLRWHSILTGNHLANVFFLFISWKQGRAKPPSPEVTLWRHDESDPKFGLDFKTEDTTQARSGYDKFHDSYSEAFWGEQGRLPAAPKLTWEGKEMRRAWLWLWLGGSQRWGFPHTSLSLCALNFPLVSEGDTWVFLSAGPAWDRKKRGSGVTWKQSAVKHQNGIRLYMTPLFLLTT